MVLAPSNEERESATPALLLWSTAAQFLNAAKKLGTDHTPPRYLACHGIELALKAHLRGRGYSLDELRCSIGHSILGAIAEAKASGMKSPPIRVRRVLEFAHEIHVTHEFRYPHLHHPRFIATNYLIFAGAWALGAAAKSVSMAEVRRDQRTRVKTRTRMMQEAKNLMEWSRPRAPPSGNKALIALLDVLARQEAIWGLGGNEGSGN
jgi:hypothetical protein